MQKAIPNGDSVPSRSTSPILRKTEASPDQVHAPNMRPPGDQPVLGIQKDHTPPNSQTAEGMGLGGPVIAHDLMSPLCTISFIIDSIADEYRDRLGPEAREMFELLQQSIERMKAVIEASFTPKNEAAQGKTLPTLLR
jgi:hypothetical protein